MPIGSAYSDGIPYREHPRKLRLSMKESTYLTSRARLYLFVECNLAVAVPSLACQGVVCAMCTRTLNLSLLGWPKEGVANGLTYGGRTNGLDMNIVTGEPGVSS